MWGVGGGGIGGRGLVELNLSCPNLHSEIPCYCPHVLRNILNTIHELGLKHLDFSLKLSPYLDHGLCDRIIRVINLAVDGGGCAIRYVVLSNSIPGGLILGGGIPVLSNIYGGLSGKLNKYISLGNVHYFRSRLHPSIKIIGCGGIETKQDVLDYLTSN